MHSGEDPATRMLAAPEGGQHDCAQHLSLSCQISAAREPRGCHLGQTWAPQTCSHTRSPCFLSPCPPRSLAQGSCSASSDGHPGFRHQTSSVVPAAHGLCTVYTRKLYLNSAKTNSPGSMPNLHLLAGHCHSATHSPSLFNVCSFKVFFF